MFLIITHQLWSLLYLLSTQIVKHISEIEHNTYTLHNGVRKSRKKLIRYCREIQKIRDINSKLKSQTRVDRFKKQQEIKKSLQNKN